MGEETTLWERRAELDVTGAMRPWPESSLTTVGLTFYDECISFPLPEHRGKPVIGDSGELELTEPTT